MNTPTPETDAMMHSGKAHYLALQLCAKLERERDEARDMLKISTSGEVCQDCGVNMSPSLIESGSCIFCIQKQTAAERDKLCKENETLRNAQKACEHCDGPTLEETKQLREVADELADVVIATGCKCPGCVSAIRAYNELPHVKKS